MSQPRIHRLILLLAALMLATFLLSPSSPNNQAVATSLRRRTKDQESPADINGKKQLGMIPPPPKPETDDDEEHGKTWLSWIFNSKPITAVMHSTATVFQHVVGTDLEKADRILEGLRQQMRNLANNAKDSKEFKAALKQMAAVQDETDIFYDANENWEDTEKQAFVSATEADAVASKAVSRRAFGDEGDEEANKAVIKGFIKVMIMIPYGPILLMMVIFECIIDGVRKALTLQRVEDTQCDAWFTKKFAQHIWDSFDPQI
ncbi:hypothetical protein HK102_011672 [Quaeritorhiza haematococci]|nr:hypothetical protein HK102_011672 [Quaeritorhiza haematococci]